MCAVDYPGALQLLAPEAAAFDDLVIVRGVDQYRKLPNKTLRLFRYAASHPKRHTHVLKTDDDCYVRCAHIVLLTSLTAHDAR